MSTPTEYESKPETPAVEDTPMTGDSDEPKATEEAEPVDLEKLKEQFKEKAKVYLIEQSRHVVIPSFAKWFDMNEIHAVEKKSFPDFFPSKTPEDGAASVYKTEETYKNMRDFMINTYRINPVEYLTVTAVRRNLAGDVASIIRIHRFLEKWGLINYQIDPRTRPSLVGPQYTGHFQITLDTPKGLTPFVPEDVSVKSATPNGSTCPPATLHDAPTVKEETESEESDIPMNIEITRNIYDDSKTTKAAPSVTYYCNETSNDVSEVRYHNLKSKVSAGGSLGPSVISKECYEQGLFPSNFSASDFVKLENGHSSAQWTQQEVLLLLEGIEMYASNENNPQSLFVNSNGQWDKISEHVASKSREECLTKFLQLPIEDRYLQKLIKSEKDESLNGNFNKDTIIQEVVKKLVESSQGQDLLIRNGKHNLEESILNQSNLINQVIELTLEKFETKMEFINRLERDYIQRMNLLESERKQVLVERWLNYEKLNAFKKTNTNLELEPLLDDLLTPVSINDINENLNKLSVSQASEPDVSHSHVAASEENLPVSIVEPKTYQFWSA